MRQPTLTWNLFFRTVPTILAVLAIIGLLAFNSAYREINNIYDAELINNANVLWNLLQRQVNRDNFQGPRRFKDLDFAMANQLSINEDVDDYADAHMFRVWKNGELAVYSSNAFQFSYPVAAAGISTTYYQGEYWRVYALHIPDTGVIVETGEKLALRNTLVSNILLNLLIPLLILVPLIGILIWLGIRGGLRKVYSLVDQIRKRSPDDLSFVATEELPRDLVPLGRSVNQLLSKLDLSLTSERLFADNAAHQLRTPHAGLKLLLQMLQKTNDDQERRQIIERLLQSNERAQHLIEQLLRAGRVSHQPLQLNTVALYDLTASLLAELGPRINEKQLDVALEGPEHAMVNTDASLLGLMLENLIENAVKYTPVAGHISVTVAQHDPQHWLLDIVDSGPGIAPQHRKAVFQRFFRIDTPEVEGTGLGLAMVADIATRLSVHISLETPEDGQGLRVRLILAKA